MIRININRARFKIEGLRECLDLRRRTSTMEKNEMKYIQKKNFIEPVASAMIWRVVRLTL